MSDRWPGVSARGVLDGDADALAGLCDTRGPSVVEYCSLICGPERAIEAASAAFAAFRAGAVRAPDPLSIDPEALLLGRTRAAAAQRAPKPAAGGLVYAEVPCSQVATLLAEHATGSLSPADRDRLRRHLARCVSCRASQGVQHQAERAYFHPSADALDPIGRQEIIEALRRAVPLSAVNGHRPAQPRRPAARPPAAASAPPRIPKPLPRGVPASGSALTSTPLGSSGSPRPGLPGGGASSGTGSPGPAVLQASIARPPATTAPTPLAAHPPPTVAPPGSPPPGAGSAHGRGDRPAAKPPQRVTPTPLEEQDTPPNGMPAAAWDSPTGVMSAVELNAALGYQQSGTGDPAIQAGGATPPAAPAPRRRSSSRVLGPAAVLVVGLLIALFVAGVFRGGSNHPPAGPSGGAPTDPGLGVQTTGSGGSARGGSAGASTGGSSGAASSATAAARERAAKRHADALARQLQAGSSAKQKTTTGSASAGTTTPKTPAGKTTKTTKTPTTKPSSTPTKKPSTTPTSSVHELGTAGGSVPPVTGVPPASSNGYQPT